jgi:hypothetical protein NreA
MSERQNKHPEVLKRLKRANGHLNSVTKMMEENRPCLEIAQQLHAVIGALENARVVFIEEHINNCLQNSLNDPESAQQVLKDFKTLTKYLK